MSMILDALARAERERKQDHTDVAREEHFERPPAEVRQPIKTWALLAVAVNLLILGAIFFYFYMQNAEQKILPATSSATLETESVASAKSDASPDRPVSKSDANTSLMAEAEVRIAATEEMQRIDPVEPSKSLHQEALVVGVTPVPKPKVAAKPKVSYSQLPLAPKAETNPVSLPPQAQAGSSYPLVKDLSSDVRSRLNKYEVNVHVHDSKPRNRFVLINMTKYREGDQIASGGPRVVEITTDGVVVDYGSGKALLQRN